MNNNGHTLSAETAAHGLVTFRLDRLMYALPIEPIVQIIEMVTITPLLGVNRSVAGSINLRGAAVPVIDLRQHLKLPDAPLKLHTPIILVQTGEWTVGMIVDEVTSVISVSDDQITNPFDVLPAGLGDTSLLRGLLLTPQGSVVLLNLRSLFSGESAQSIAALQALPNTDNGHLVSIETEPLALPLQL